MSEMTQEQIAERLAEIERELEELKSQKALAEEPEKLDESLRRVQTAQERLKQSLAALEEAADRISQLARTA